MLWLRCRALGEAHAAAFGVDLEVYLGRQQDLLDFEAKGKLVCCEADADGRPVGYIMWLLSVHPGVDGPVAKMGPWYVEPKWRGNASRQLYKFSLGVLRSRKVSWAMTTLPARKRRHWPIFGHLHEMTYLRDLREGPSSAH